MTIIYFILILGITVFVHELGHFMFAKKFGVHVYEFSIGMGPKLFKFKRKNDETDYCIRLLPIGGFVQMAGEEIEVDEDIPEDKRLQSKPAFQRFLIMIAGVTMNFVLAIIILFIIGLTHTISMDNIYIDESTIPGLEDGTKIVAVDGHFVNNYDKLALELTCVGDKDFTITVKNKIGKKNISISPVAVGKSNLVYGIDYGFNVAYEDDNFVVKDSKIENLKDGSILTTINGEKINDYTSLLHLLKDSEDNPVLGYTYNDEVNEIELTTTELTKDELTGYNYGFYLKGKPRKGFFAALKYAFVKFFSTIEQMIFTVYYLIIGRLSAKLLSGPVGIYNVVSVYSKTGLTSIMNLLALICINVGFINILPLPAFDGGHVLFIVIEKIKGSRVNPKVENIIHTIGFILLLILMVLVTYNDIVKLF